MALFSRSRLGAQRWVPLWQDRQIGTRGELPLVRCFETLIQKGADVWKLLWVLQRLLACQLSTIRRPP